MTRKDEESYISFVKRVTNECSNKNISYTEWGDTILGYENVYSEDNCRKGFYIVSKLLNKIDDSVEITDTKLFEELEELRCTVYKEKCKLQDERRLKNKDLREESRFENLVDCLKDNIEMLPPIKLNVCTKEIQDGIEASLLISDVHAGLKVDNVVNYYDIEVCKDRLSQLLSKTIKYCKINKVTKLNVEFLGDLVNGIIKVQNRIDEEEDTISQITTISEILSQFVNELKKEIPTVVMYGVIGNHSALFANKHERSRKENFERLIYKFISMRVNQPVITNGLEDFLTYKVGNREIVLSHGDKDNISNAKQHFTDLLGRKVDAIHFGHIHHFNVKDDCNTDIIVNGSVISTDDYAVSLRRNTKASQTLIIYDEDMATYKITLE